MIIRVTLHSTRLTYYVINTKSVLQNSLDSYLLQNIFISMITVELLYANITDIADKNLKIIIL